ncbi:transcriptional regulator with XRE-family HTH domain [Bradyrhizobium sp. USDA 4524]|uniref:helix-turn-helix domain-containing protein n=1 Tax=unclassified Bradyrhizobium TaxID=2631580 RepID=UPI00209F645C|nr:MULTISPECIES: helix-turn-helix transcriptional regulator [unclassified Bradyrhizobium]MCP1845793.1 transcriptional regulator with XRE-family HTH domain [Bradyrhizobium sp. USDA 4538]MCP1906884.1 transcriptional regulator with XRE-family HTH domain [Bradyrhizobium sp. USDA 4537]MCP1985359.1 transcriptional regulator with XRE-family HTH domain [Bradyrhizobium sp. USDA 4539]
MKPRALLAWNVRRIRLKRGISQEKLARAAGIDRSYLAGLERQSKNPTIDVLDSIAEKLGVQPSELFAEPSNHADTLKTSPKRPKPAHLHRKRQ